MRTEPTIARFLQKFVQGNPNECWEWQAGRQKFGYGTIWHNGSSMLAHRFSYEYFVGPIPEGLLILHSCDNPPCVNPAHLHPGTYQTNSDECFERGRGNRAKGEKQSKAKLTAEDVIQIRTTHAKDPIAVVASKFGVSDVLISYIRLRRIWKHI